MEDRYVQKKKDNDDLQRTTQKTKDQATKTEKPERTQALQKGKPLLLVLLLLQTQ